MQDERTTKNSKSSKSNASNDTSPSSSSSSFNSLAHSWWDRRGAFSMLHKLQPTRMRYLRRAMSAQFASATATDESTYESTNESTNEARSESTDAATDSVLPKLRVLDIGCGGGLLSESLARLGFEVIGIDSSASSIDVARAHAREYMPEHSEHSAERDSVSPISYHHASLSDFAKSEPAQRRFDLICALEVIEHVADKADRQEFFDLASHLLRPRGLFIISTLNRTFESWLKGIVVAEYILGLVPRSTHDWQSFITPLELESLASDSGLRVTNFCGMRYRPLRDDFVLDSGSLSFNYIASATK